MTQYRSPYQVPGVIWASLPAPAFLIDRAGKIAAINPAAETFLNASSRSLTGVPAFDRLHIDAPMDEALASAAIDIGGRPYYVGRLPSKLYTHFLHSFATNLGATLHVDLIRGEDRHHMVEAAIKATGSAIRQALANSAEDAVFSTKGSVKLERLD